MLESNDNKLVEEQTETEIELIDPDIVDLIMTDIIAPFIAEPYKVEKNKQQEHELPAP